VASLVLFDDRERARDARLSPLTDLRASFDVRTGALTTLERASRMFGAPAGVLVPVALEGVTRERHGGIVNRVDGEGPVLLLNGRCVLPPAEASGLAVGESLVEAASGEVVAARLSAAAAREFAAGGGLPGRARELAGRRLIARAWHVKAMRDAALTADLSLLAGGPTTYPAGQGAPVPGSAVVFGVHGLTMAAGARVCPGATLDLEGGAIVLAPGSTVRPGAIVQGPAYVGERATVVERAIVKAQTAIGPWCKVGGEVGGTIFQGFANKAHDGHLGDSWIGEWVNLGAGTTNSNLLNTYGQVAARATPGGAMERTGEQFLGCVLGDHVKTAIGTRIMTGAIVGTGAMWAATAPVSGCVAAFAWATDAGVRAFRLDKFLEVARAAMARRGREPSAAEIALLGALHGASGSA